MSDADIREHVLAAVRDFNASQDEEQQVPAAPEAYLIGDGGCLDSVGLVGLIVAVEQHIQDELQVSITLADERAFSRERSPFRTLGDLADYVSLLVREQTGG